MSQDDYGHGLLEGAQRQYIFAMLHVGMMYQCEVNIV
jgi:hypothetical protein